MLTRRQCCSAHARSPATVAREGQVLRPERLQKQVLELAVAVGLVVLEVAVVGHPGRDGDALKQAQGAAPLHAAHEDVEGRRIQEVERVCVQERAAAEVHLLVRQEQAGGQNVDAVVVAEAGVVVVVAEEVEARGIGLVYLGADADGRGREQGGLDDEELQLAGQIVPLEGRARSLVLGLHRAGSL